MTNLALVIVLLAALMTPLLMAKFKMSYLPTAVAEIIVGIILGTSGFHLIVSTPTLTELSTLGVTVLIFLSGMEIDFDLFKKQPTPTDPQLKVQPSPVRLAITSFAFILLISFGLSGLLAWSGFFKAIGLATILFSTIALGVVIAALKEKELLSQPLGQTILLIAVLGEIIPLVALTVYSSLNNPGSKSLWLLSLIFVAAIYLLVRFKGVYHFFARIDKSTTQLDIRLAFFLIITLVSIAEEVGAESILGAFLAGMVMKLLRPREETTDKLTSIGYGFFIPIFFIMTGAKLDLPALLADRKSLSLIPFFFIGFMLSKAATYWVLKRRFKQTNAIAGTFLSATTITLVLPILTVGLNLKTITEQQSGAFTLAAILSCILGPILFNRFYQPTPEDLPRKRVKFIGANIMTIPIAQQLSNGLYTTQLFTDNQGNYEIYHSAADLTLLPDLSEDSLVTSGAFDADIIILGYLNHEQNYRLAQLALDAKVPRIIARFEAKDILDEKYDQLKEQGVEVFNTYEANISLLRSLIETPSTLQIIDNTDAGLFEVTVQNRRFTGLQISNLPFVDQVTISRIYRNQELIMPHGDTQIHLNDHLILTGNKKAVPAIRQQLETRN
ncbi:cation:proton antiporter family protein [Latilactobacillus sakei]|uniref:cation:proton antiporter family protein n=1 Tax=Latilactobacillus sakei TaxID=1599 RepID=UPI000978C3A5|nr:cation:proton antiporter family protein [Latilactobacillus sakei]MCM1597656.1 cation:proton antiporter [Latilactobacillus sakei]